MREVRSGAETRLTVAAAAAGCSAKKPRRRRSPSPAPAPAPARSSGLVAPMGGETERERRGTVCREPNRSWAQVHGLAPDGPERSPG